MTSSHNVTLVTGASGFVGGAVFRSLQNQARTHAIGTCLTPRPGSALTCGPALDARTDWRPLLKETRSVVHCAARVHIMRDSAISPLHAYRQTNTLGTLNLARQAAASGVRRFMFLSSIKVLGEETSHDSTFRADSSPCPLDSYALSKLEAEDGLRAIADETGMEVVIIRPPLVYGAGVKGNFATMIQWVAKGIPLPLGAIRHNRRTLVALDNLVDLILLCLHHPAAANHTFLAGDDDDFSTTGLLEGLARAMGRPSRLLPIPVRLLESAAGAIGKRQEARRLCGSLRVDISETRSILGWSPPVTTEQGLHNTVQRT